MKIFVLIAAGFVVAAAPLRGAPDESSAALTMLRERFVRSVLPVEHDDVATVHRIASDYARTLGSDGRWPDIRYTEADRVFWSGGKHLERVLLMAKSARLRRDRGAPDGSLVSKAITALKAWTGPDAQNSNWWWNRIGIPEVVAEIDCLLWSDLPPEEIAAGVKILRRSSMERMTGANLTWCAINQVLLGCLENLEMTTRAAYDRLYAEIHVANAASNFEGIQPDFSFHQHGAQFYSGGYGLFFANDVGRFIYAAWGTPFQIPDARRKIFDDFMLEGMRWMTCRDLIDYSTLSRVITREGIVAVPRDWSLGPISPAGPAYSLGHVVRLLATLPGGRHADYAEWAARLAGGTSTPEFTGNRYFWRSDYMVQRRDTFVASVKMFSARLKNGEVVNGEGRKSQHLSDGANFLYVNGDEYRDIFPVWDWQKVPGTTAEQVADMDTIEPKAVGTLGKTDFVGGVSDGRAGLCVMDLRRGQLAAHKAWFFLDDAYVCLGAGIEMGNNHSVVTTINQTWLHGDVRTDAASSPLAIGEHALESAHWVHHDRVGYVFPAGARLQLSNENQTGRWSDLGAGSDQPVTQPVFKLWMDHGAHPQGASYEYIVLPAVSAVETAARAKAPGIVVLSNTASLQAIFAEAPRIGAVAFWRAGKIATPLGVLEVDQPCLLLLRAEGEGVSLMIANPRSQPSTVQWQVGDHFGEITLPGGDEAGASVAQRFPVSR